MGRFLFFLLLVANLAFGAHLWLSRERDAPDLSRREKNAGEVKIVSVTPPVSGQQKADEARRQAVALAGAACVEFTGIAGTEVGKVREALATLRLGERLTERRLEEVTRHWVYIPPAKDRKTAEAAAAQLKRQGVTELSIRPDYAISLGVFSTEDAAFRYLGQVESKGARGVQVGPFARELKDLVFTIREPDTELVARLTLMQRDYPGSALKAMPCPEK
ncbi:MAG: SPOR domain-containing protein [Betaproteobacteria bacterium]|nr:SPOR domain-containing protein [Betaproteobacteria bacterium]